MVEVANIRRGKSLRLVLKMPMVNHRWNLTNLTNATSIGTENCVNIYQLRKDFQKSACSAEERNWKCLTKILAQIPEHSSPTLSDAPTPRSVAIHGGQICRFADLQISTPATLSKLMMFYILMKSTWILYVKSITMDVKSFVYSKLISIILNVWINEWIEMRNKEKEFPTLKNRHGCKLLSA